RHIRPALAKFFGPDITAGVVHEVRLLRAMSDRLTQDRGDDALRRALHQLHGERTADAVAEEKQLPDAEMIHHAELIVGESLPRIVDRHRAGGFAIGRVALVHRYDAEVVLELLHDVDHGGRPIADTGV